jgi:RNA polymerase sigma-70 factor, ECF subfamily
VSTIAWIDVALRGARPQAMGALLRYFRDLDLAEEAFQEACLRALKSWPKNGPPRDTVAWLVLVGRNAALDGVRRRKREYALPGEEALSDLSDAEGPLAEQLDEAGYRDDLLRLLFMCCHPELPATQQIALALRIVCGLTVPEIARAFLVTDAAMEQRITRAKRLVAAERIPFETPGAPERAERLSAVAAVLYLLFNEGYSATGGSAHVRVPLCDEAIRLARLLLRLFPGEPEMLGLTALMLLQHSRSRARLDAQGAIVLLEDQDRGQWDRDRIAEALALLEKALRHGSPGPYQLQAAIAALHARAPRFEDTDWAEIEQFYAALERLQPSPVVSLNRAVAVAKLRGPAAALAMVDALAKDLAGYFYFFGVRGALLMDLGRPDEARREEPVPPSQVWASACQARWHRSIVDRGLRRIAKTNPETTNRKDAPRTAATVIGW